MWSEVMWLGVSVLDSNSTTQNTIAAKVQSVVKYGSDVSIFIFVLVS
jgi:hypothetical protein